MKCYKRSRLQKLIYRPNKPRLTVLYFNIFYKHLLYFVFWLIFFPKGVCALRSGSTLYEYSVLCCVQGKPITAAATQPKRGNHEVEAEKMWTLPLARRMTPATIGKSMTRVLRRFNGIAQTSDDDVECCRSANNSVVNASASAGMMMTRDADCPADVVDRLSVTSPVGADVVQSVSEEDRSTEQQAVLAAAKEARTLYIDNGASVSACAANAAESRRLIEPTTQSGNCVPVPGPSNQAQSATAASPSTASTNEIRQPEPESSGIVCSKLEQLTGASPTVNDSTRRLMSRPAQRSSSGNGGDFASRRPPVQPRASPPGSSFQRRHSATQARTDYSLPLAGGFMTVMASRTSSCEVLVDDDDDDVETRLTAEDMVRWRRRHSGVSAVTRRSSSCASSLADDTESTAASETDSCTAAQNVDVDDLIAYSLLDSLLMRLRSPARDFPSREFLPRDSPRSLCGQRRPSSQMSMSWSSSDEDEADGKRRGAGVDVTAETSVLPSTISGRACSSLLSSLDDLASECCSDFELGSSLSQLILLTPGKIQPEKSPSGKTPRHPSASRNNGRLSSSAASLTELPSRAGLNQLHSYRRQWTENSSYVPPPSEPQRQCADTAGTPVKGHALMTDASVTELSAPIAASLPARVHVAKTSRIPKY